MRKKYLLWGYAIIAVCVIIALCSITFSSFLSMAGARNHMSDPEHRKTMYNTAAKVSKDTGLDFPDFQIYEHKPGEFLDGNVFRDTLVVFFHKGISDKVYRSFEEKAKAIEAGTDSAKSVEIDSINYRYQDFYVHGFTSYLGVHISKDSQYGEIIYGNWKPAKE